MTVELVTLPFCYFFKPRKVGLSDYGSRGLHEGGGNYLKYLKKGRTKNRGGETKILKKGVRWTKSWVL